MARFTDVNLVTSVPSYLFLQSKRWDAQIGRRGTWGRGCTDMFITIHHQSAHKRTLHHCMIKNQPTSFSHPILRCKHSNRWFSRYVITAIGRWTVNKRSLISSLCLSTSICSFHHCYLCPPRLLENHLFMTCKCKLSFPSFLPHLRTPKRANAHRLAPGLVVL